MVATLTDKIGTEAETINDKMQIMQLSKQVSNAFDGEYVTNLHYCYYAATSALIGINGIAYSMNSIYDPDIDNGSGNFQPIGRDTWASIYNYYKVVKSKVWFQWGMNSVMGNTDNMNAGADALPCLVGGMLDISAQEPLTMISWLNAAELGSTNRQQSFSPIKHIDINTNGSNTSQVNMEWNPTLFESAIIDQSAKDTWTPVGSNPDNPEYFVAIMYNPGLNTKHFWYRVHIEYTVAFKQVNRTILNSTN